MAQADEVQSASMRQRLVSSPLEVVERRCQLNQRLQKWLLWPFLSQATRSPNAHGRKELLRTVVTQAFGKFTLRRIECH